MLAIFQRLFFPGASESKVRLDHEDRQHLAPAQ
jgi:hypothetical protein